jgi:hypothetical protein
MQHEKAQRLQASNNGAPCDHPELDKEYMAGMQTGDYVCTSCGESFSPSEVSELRSEQAKRAKE